MVQKVVTEDIFICEEVNERFGGCFPDENCGFGRVRQGYFPIELVFVTMGPCLLTNAGSA